MENQRKSVQQTDPWDYGRTRQKGSTALKEKAESGNLYTSETFDLKTFLTLKLNNFVKTDVL